MITHHEQPLYLLQSFCSDQFWNQEVPMYNEQQSTCLSSSWWFDKYLSTTPFFFSSSFHKPSTHTTESQFSEPLFSEPQFSEILDLMNKLQLLFFIFHSLSRIDLVNSLDLVNKRGLTTMFTKSSLGCTTHTQVVLV